MNQWRGRRRGGEDKEEGEGREQGGQKIILYSLLGI